MDKKEITDYIFLDDKDPKGDIAFVFGTWKAWKESVEKAVELYKNKLVSRIIFSGGANRETGVIEGPAMAEEAVKLGVPCEDILIEDKSSNTLENVIFSLVVIDKEIGLSNIETITAVVKNYHARRGLMTLKKHIPNHIKLKAAPYITNHHIFTKDNWSDSESGKVKVMDEIEKIKKYLAKGDLDEL